MGLGKELLELVVIGFKLSQLGSVGRLHAAKAGAPLVEGWLAKATGPAKFLDGHARVSLRTFWTGIKIASVSIKSSNLSENSSLANRYFVPDSILNSISKICEVEIVAI